MTTCSESALIGSISELRKFLPVLSKSTALYLHIEGWNLCRHGAISVITILLHPSSQAQLIDVSALGDLAFSTTSEVGKSLRSILEDHSICKYIWDVRNDADTLWFHYRVRFGGITNLQLLENTSRSDDKTYVRGLDKCAQYDSKLGFMKTSRWLRTKEDIKKLMRNDIFFIPPIDPKIIEYCQNDVIYLPDLREIYLARIKPEWLTKVKEESEHRVVQAQSREYDPQSKEKKLGPWGSGGNQRILTIDQVSEMMEEEREDTIARDLFWYGNDLEYLDDGDDGWNQEGPGDYED